MHANLPLIRLKFKVYNDKSRIGLACPFFYKTPPVKIEWHLVGNTASFFFFTSVSTAAIPN